MSTPVGGVNSVPLYGGLSGYKRDLPSKPTSIPGGIPAFRGKAGKPGDIVKAPAIRTSYNRQDQGTNVCIPYSRIVPLHHLEYVGRVQSGDVVFHSTYRVNRMYRGSSTSREDFLKQDRVETKMRLVGIDWMNKQLGGRPEYDATVDTPQGMYAENWVVGENVILGSDTDRIARGVRTSKPFDPTKDNVADEWRSLPALREWVCDGVVLSNDEPGCHQSNGTNDGQLFNIAVQGVCALNNGHCAPPHPPPAPRPRPPPPHPAPPPSPHPPPPLCCTGSRLQGRRRRVGAPLSRLHKGGVPRRWRAAGAPHVQVVWWQLLPPRVPQPNV